MISENQIENYPGTNRTDPLVEDYPITLLKPS